MTDGSWVASIIFPMVRLGLVVVTWGLTFGLQCIRHTTHTKNITIPTTYLAINSYRPPRLTKDNVSKQLARPIRDVVSWIQGTFAHGSPRRHARRYATEVSGGESYERANNGIDPNSFYRFTLCNLCLV